MTEISKHGQLGLAALRAGMDRKTARKYVSEGKLPSELRKPHTWRTRPDPFEEVWPEVEARLELAPELEAKILFEDLTRRHDGFSEGQLRTFQRRVREWRARRGPDKEVFFPQEHRPGEAGQTDFTSTGELGITIAGDPLDHLICQFVLPYSNWQWPTVCFSESLLALRRGVQSAVFRLGSVPKFLQTDNSTAATHQLSAKDKEETEGNRERGFNEEYVRMIEHLGMKPRTIGIGKSEQNGDVESSHGVLKRRLEQHLLLRGSRDFESLEAYERWVQDVCEQANRLRDERLGEELAVMSALRVDRLPEYSRVDVSVTSWSTIRVKRNTYSVPSRLIGERLRVHLYEDRLEVLHGPVLQLVTERLRGGGKHRINYRHVIGSLVRKPGAFERYRYREDLFPTLVFRRAYDALVDSLTSRKSDIEYLRLLHLAARTMESDVEAALELFLADGTLPLCDDIKPLVEQYEPEVPDLAIPVVDLTDYDELLDQLAAESS